MYRQILDPVAHSLAWSSLAAVLPLATLFLMLGVLRVRAWMASLVSLAVALAIAVAIYRMPIGQDLAAIYTPAVGGSIPSAPTIKSQVRSTLSRGGGLKRVPIGVIYLCRVLTQG